MQISPNPPPAPKATSAPTAIKRTEEIHRAVRCIRDRALEEVRIAIQRKSPRSTDSALQTVSQGEEEIQKHLAKVEGYLQNLHIDLHLFLHPSALHHACSQLEAAKELASHHKDMKEIAGLVDQLHKQVLSAAKELQNDISLDSGEKDGPQ